MFVCLDAVSQTDTFREMLASKGKPGAAFGRVTPSTLSPAIKKRLLLSRYHSETEISLNCRARNAKARRFEKAHSATSIFSFGRPVVRGAEAGD